MESNSDYYNILDDKIKHSAAHILATAVLRVFPDAKVGIGPVTDKGFYYDFDIGQNITEDKKNLILSEINNIIQSNLPITQKILNKEDGIKMLLQIGQIYKAEMINSIPDEEVSFFSIGNEFIDLCRGPHVKSTGEVGPIIIENMTETHWNEDIRRPKMVRIYGRVFNNFNELQNYLHKENLKTQYNYINIIKKDSSNKIYDNDTLTVSYGQKLSEKIQKTEKLIDKIIKKEDHIRLYLQNAYLNIQRLEEDLKEIFKSNSISYKLIQNKISYYIKTFLHESDLGIEYANLNKSIDISVIYYITEPNNVDLDKITDNLCVDFEEFGIDRKDIHLEIHAKSLSDNMLIQLSQMLQKKLISHTKVINDTLQCVYIKAIAENLFNQKWCLEEIKIDTSNNLFRINDKDNCTTNTIVIRKTLSKDILFRFLISNPNKTKIQDNILNSIICIPIKRYYNTEAIKLSSYLKYNGFDAKADITSTSLNKKVKKHLSNGTNFIIFLGEKEKISNSVSLRIGNQDIGLISLDDLLAHIKYYSN